MTAVPKAGRDESLVPVINLANAPGERQAWARPKLVVYLWAVVELIFVTNPWQVSSKMRIKALRLFGAKIGEDVIFRPRTRVKFPWNLSIGDRSWIGEGVWIHNQGTVSIGSDVVVSQETFITNGSHAHRRDMALILKPVRVDDGAWLTTRTLILGGSVIGRSAIIQPNTVVSANSIIPENTIYGLPPAAVTGQRFDA